MKEWIAVACGGMLGAMLRHGIAALLGAIAPAWGLLATLLANAFGCFAIGWLFAWSLQTDLQNQWIVVGVRVGLLGGLTTFSSFALELVRLWYDGRATASATLLLLHLTIGIAAVVLGAFIAGGIPGSIAGDSPVD